MGVSYPLTGILVGLADYRVAFWAGAAFVVSALVVVIVALPAGPDARASRAPFNGEGAVLLSGTLTSLLPTVSERPRWGWGTPAHDRLLRVGRSAARGVDPGRVECAASAHQSAGVAHRRSSLIAQAPTSTGYGIGLPVPWTGFVMLPLSVGSFGANRIVRVRGKIKLAALPLIGAATITGSTVLLLFAHDALWEIMVGPTRSDVTGGARLCQ